MATSTARASSLRPCAPRTRTSTGRAGFVVNPQDFPESIGVVWLAYTECVGDRVWRRQPIAGPGGDKHDLLQLIDRDNDGDPDVLTTGKGRAIDDRGHGVIWFKNPTWP